MRNVVLRVLCGGVLVLSGTVIAADDAKDTPTAAVPRVTDSLRVKSPSVTVRANPKSSSPKQQGSGQYAFIDEHGELTSTPPADFAFPEESTARTTDPAPTRSAVDPNAILFDTSHIHAVLRARVGEDGAAVAECFHSTDPAVRKVCAQPHDAPEPEKSVRARNDDAREDYR